MSWMAKLSETYDQLLQQNYSQAIVPDPLNHIVQNAHINITIDRGGNFLSAKVLEERTQTVLPATEKSAGRTSGEAPHPLADKIQYVAGDYKDFGGKKRSYFESYRQQLNEWCQSKYSRPSARAVLAYVNRKSVLSDLIRSKIAIVDENKTLLVSWASEEEQPKLFKILPKKNRVLDQGDAFVCWTVEDPEILFKGTWLDKDLQAAWSNYENNRAKVEDVCYVSGLLEESIAINHPARLRSSGDKAKIISSNDLKGFTFRGRFTDGKQAVTIGVETTQKAHSALRWLIKRREAKRNGDQTIVAWAISGHQIPDPFVGTDQYDLDDFSESDTPLSSNNEPTVDHAINLGKIYTEKLGRFMAGYRAKLPADDTISVMAIDSATPGRMNITYYREHMPSDYLDTISKWHTDFAWSQRINKEISEANGKTKKVPQWIICAPSPYSIVSRIYGNLLKGNESLKKNFYERIIPCILEGSSIPFDIVASAVYSASSPAGKETWEWESSLGIACALFRGFHIRHLEHSKTREFSMALEKDNTSRDYLYGRLLAIAERLEDVALRASGVERPTTANRLMQRFADHPCSTWLIIYKQIGPYMSQLRTSRAGFLMNMNKELDEVMSLFESSEFKRDTKLSGEFLLGFHAERLSLRNTNLPSESDSSETTEN